VTNGQKDKPQEPQGKVANAPGGEETATPRADNVPVVLSEVLRSAGVDTSDPKVSRALEISFMFFSGSLPLPPAEMLQKWEPLFPGITAKFVDWTERQSRHRQYLEKLRTERSENRMDRSQMIAAAVALGGLALSALVGIFGNPYVAGVIAVVSVGGPTAAVAIASRGRKAPSQRPPPKR
jgi:hypothetical protein